MKYYLPVAIGVIAIGLVGALMLGGPELVRAEAESTTDSRDEAPIDFNRDIRPILSDKCIYCHGPDAHHREADLRLDVEEDAKDYAIVPGELEESEAYLRIIHDDVKERMPPVASGKKLSAKEIDLIRRWIEQGAAWADHWAYVEPERHEPPAVKQADWPLHWIDRFVLSRLESEGLRPSPEADRVTLIRRLSFDLTGLPPTPEEVAAFVNDRDPQAYEKLVDRLLASPHFGERMAVYWLDLVRYADTVGYHGDQGHVISPYRDWVIYALNHNMPVDQFTHHQLAGDLIADRDAKQLSETQIMNLKIASGYNRLLQTTHEGGLQKKEYRAIYQADRIRNLTNVWMGATMGCCQCHDHKFDPFTTKDFYSMGAFFADVDEDKTFSAPNGVVTVRNPEMPVPSQQQSEELARLAAEIEKLKKQPGAGKKIKALEQQRATLQKQIRRTMITQSVEPRTVRILPRGNWLDETGPIVMPAIPEFMGKLDVGDRRATRLDLAQWLTDTEHGSGLLTARVFANRFWYLMFGNGITAILDDFGGQGKLPEHPELLDGLAVEFVKSGWDRKHVIKLLAMSRAYRQSSLASESLLNRDPYNALVARQSRFRLPAEMVRDNALSISGLLVDELGGESVKPYQPPGYYRHLNFPQRKYQQHNDQRQWRRGVYMHWQRQFLHPMLKALDAPSREECTAARPRSNTPLAALTLLNDPTFVEAARVFAQRMLREGGGTVDGRLDFAFRLAVSRDPDDFERQILKELLEMNQKVYKADPEAALAIIAVGLAPADKALDAVTLASWTAVARAILNFNETITRN